MVKLSTIGPWQRGRGSLLETSLLLLAVLWGTSLPLHAAPNLAEPAAAVDAARDSFGPADWYDAENDEFRPVELKAPRPSRQGGSWGITFGGWLRFAAWLLFALLLGLVAWLIVRAFLNRENQQLTMLDELDLRRTKPDITRVEELPLILSTPPEDYLSAAHRYYQRGEYGPAILYLFSHQLLELDRGHWLYLVKGKTNRQYLREVSRAAAAAREELAAILEGTVLLFEEVYFGKRIPPREAIDQAWRQIDRFESLVTQQSGQTV